MSNLYWVDADASEPDRIRPVLPEGVSVTWVAQYDPGTQKFVVLAEKDIEGLTPIPRGKRVGFDIKPLLTHPLAKDLPTPKKAARKAPAKKAAKKT